jgi:hypothetical protein
MLGEVLSNTNIWNCSWKKGYRPPALKRPHWEMRVHEKDSVLFKGWHLEMISSSMGGQRHKGILYGGKGDPVIKWAGSKGLSRVLVIQVMCILFFSSV